MGVGCCCQNLSYKTPEKFDFSKSIASFVGLCQLVPTSFGGRILTKNNQSRHVEDHDGFKNMLGIYCGWKKSCTTWDVENPVNNGISYLSTGAGLLPSTVCYLFRV